MKLKELFEPSDYIAEGFVDDLPLFEMAYLDRVDTGIDSNGVIFASVKYPQHACRVKYFPNINEKSRLMIVSVEDSPKTYMDKLGWSTDTNTKKEVIKFVQKNRKIILDFWDKGEFMNRQEVNNFWNKLHKLTAAERKAARKLTLIYAD